jgi:hypothetical protein
MRRTRWAVGLVGTVLAVADARPADPNFGTTGDRPEPVIVQVQVDSKGKEVPKAKEPPKSKEPVPEAEPNLIARTDLGGLAPPDYFTRMLGDWIGATYANQIVTLPGTQVVTTTLTTTQTSIQTVVGPNGELIRVQVTNTIPIGTKTTAVPVLVTTNALVPVLSRAAFKIAENEKPTPEDRFILTYNGYSGLPGALPAPPGSIFNTTNGLPFSTSISQIGQGGRAQQPVLVAQNFVTGGAPTLVQTVVPSPTTFVHREVIGFEKTLFGGVASVGVRAPFFQQEGDGSIAGSDFGDLTFIFKYLAWTNGPDAVTAGLAVTAPTGPAIPTVEGDIHSTLFQPFVGARVQSGDVFALAFSSVAIPTDSRDVTILFNDLAVGFVMNVSGPDGLIRWVAPTAEVHVTTPLTHRNGSGLLTVPDLVVLTEGVQVGFGSGTAVNLGVGVPVTGPRPFDLEAFLQLNFRY